MKSHRIARLVAAAPACVLFLLNLHPGYGQAPRQQAWAILQSGTTDKNSETRVAAVTVLALIPGDPRAAGLAVQALNDQDPDVRKAAAGSLGTLKAKSAIPALRNALKDQDGNVVLAAAHALVMTGSETGYGVYYALVTGERKSGESLIGSQEQEVDQMLHNPKGMAEMAFEQGIGYAPFGGIAWGAYQKFHSSENQELVVKATAVKMLAKDPDPRSGTALVNATGDSHWEIRAAAYDAIARRGDSSLLPQITKGLNDDKDVARLTAAAAVAQLSTLPKK
ncbi:MAG: HEAT repeat domain-containing protein [Acidobacteriaceae bacterium]|nr:HEAT repeat domain-containing protein [Acidobacteriaceae bacterium]MBV8573294.1 HEAT repeat domain-containing protein [Acidobacteriaceae bacterium]